MKVLLCLCFLLFTNNEATGQTVDPVCQNVSDFDPCISSGDCDDKISRCICFKEQQLCRCNSLKGEFYLDEACSQKWTVVTFALVASLPGLTLAVLVGVIVYMLPSKNSHTGKEMKTPNTASKGQDLFPGIAFASDMDGRPPPVQRPVQQDHVPMTAMPNRSFSMLRDSPVGGPTPPYSVSSGVRDPPMGGPARPYSPSNSMRPSADIMTNGRPHEPQSMFSGIRGPPMGVPVQPYSNGAGRDQIARNPYARDSPGRNPYEDRSQSDYRAQAPAHTYDNLHQQNQIPPYSPAPLYGSSEHGGTRQGFPRPQLNLQY